MGNKKPKIVSVTNTDAVSTDRVCTPIALNVPLVLIEDCEDQLWWTEEVMDYSAASQLRSTALISGILARIITIQLILPAADEVNAVSSDLDEITAEPLRVKLKTPTRR